MSQHLWALAYDLICQRPPPLQARRHQSATWAGKGCHSTCMSIDDGCCVDAPRCPHFEQVPAQRFAGDVRSPPDHERRERQRPAIAAAASSIRCALIVCYRNCYRTRWYEKGKKQTENDGEFENIRETVTKWCDE